MDEKTEKEWQELQGKVMDNQSKLKSVRLILKSSIALRGWPGTLRCVVRTMSTPSSVVAGIRAKQGEKKRNELTEQSRHDFNPLTHSSDPGTLLGSVPVSGLVVHAARATGDTR
eukprot:5803695-Pyramimonas_sp.AAC.1